MNHHPKLLYVDTVRAFHFGVNFLVEVDIVLPEDMTLKEAHDIGEPLQQKLESLPEVERAFVHLDYEFEHRPSDEHKQVWIFWFWIFWLNEWEWKASTDSASDCLDSDI